MLGLRPRPKEGVFLRRSRLTFLPAERFREKRSQARNGSPIAESTEAAGGYGGVSGNRGLWNWRPACVPFLRGRSHALNRFWPERLAAVRLPMAVNAPLGKVPRRRELFAHLAQVQTLSA
jgi:hypothetical protein